MPIMGLVLKELVDNYISAVYLSLIPSIIFMISVMLPYATIVEHKATICYHALCTANSFMCLLIYSMLVIIQFIFAPNVRFRIMNGILICILMFTLYIIYLTDIHKSMVKKDIAYIMSLLLYLLIFYLCIKIKVI